MPLTTNAGQPLSAEKRLAQVDRIIHSPVLQNSESLCNLLKFLARQSIDTPEVSVKEYQIATQVFGRSTGFDPRVDSTVRVQMSRLRSKLTDYYSHAGSADPIVVEIPKGSHAVTFREREAEPSREAEPVPIALETSISIPARTTPWKWIAVISTMASLVLAAVLLARPWTKPLAAVPAAASADPVSLFWRGLLQSPEEPLVVFSNAEFVGRPETGLRYYRPNKDAADSVFDHYTGVGEVISIHELDQVFARLGRPVHLKRGRLLNWDDTKNRDLVFLGSPSENLSLRELSLGQEFHFQTMLEAPRKGDLGIVNLHPAAGEAPVYFGSKDLPITEDYAVVELAPSPSGARILLLAGTTTFGTQGAVEFVCDAERVRDLLARVRNSSGGLESFSALLHIKVNRGVPVEGELVAVHRK